MNEAPGFLGKIKTYCIQNKITSAVIGILILVCAAAGWYFLYWVKTPAYSLYLVKDAVQKHDTAAFNKHVDMQTLFGQLYDDVMNQAMKEEGVDNPFVVGLAAAFKPAAVNYLMEETKKAIASDTVVEKDQKNNAANTIIDKTGAAHTQFVDVTDTVKRDGTAVVSVKVRDAKLGKDFLLKINMTELEDGTWKVVSFANIPEYLEAYKNAEEEKLKEYNASIQQKIDAIASIEKQGQPTLSLTQRSGSLGCDLIITNKSGETIQSMQIHSQVLDGDGNILYESTDPLNAPINAGTALSIGFKHDLNPFIEKEKKIADLGAEQITMQFGISSIVTDKGEIKRLTALPE